MRNDETFFPELSEKDRQAIDAAKRRVPDSTRIREIRKTQEAGRRELDVVLNRIVRDRVDGKIAVSRGHALAKSAFARLGYTALCRGFALAGVPDWKAVQSQMDALMFWCNFQADKFENLLVATASDAMSRSQRVSLYVGALDQPLWSGWASTLPGGVSIEWVLGVAEHCADCLELEEKSPYTPPGTGGNELPTTPRAGDTRCLGNCRCYIRSKGAVETTLVPVIGAEVTAVGGHSIDPTSEAARKFALVYQEAAKTAAYYVRMDAAFPGQGYDAMAADIVATMNRMAESLNQTVRRTATNAEIVEPVVFAKSMGFTPVDPTNLRQNLIGLVAIIIALDSGDRGTITDVSASPPSVVIDKERVWRLDEYGRALLMLEKSP